MRGFFFVIFLQFLLISDWNRGKNISDYFRTFCERVYVIFLGKQTIKHVTCLHMHKQAY